MAALLGYPEAISPLLQLTDDSDLWGSQYLLAKLVSKDLKSALPMIQKGLEDKNDRVSMKALTSLPRAAWGDPELRRRINAALGESEILGKNDPAPPKNPLVSCTCRDKDIKEVFAIIARDSGAKIVVSDELKGQVTCSINNVPWRDLLLTLAATLNFKVVWEEPMSARVVADR